MLSLWSLPSTFVWCHAWQKAWIMYPKHPSTNIHLAALCIDGQTQQLTINALISCHGILPSTGLVPLDAAADNEIMLSAQRVAYLRQHVPQHQPRAWWAHTIQSINGNFDWHDEAAMLFEQLSSMNWRICSKNLVSYDSYDLISTCVANAWNTHLKHFILPQSYEVKQ